MVGKTNAQIVSGSGGLPEGYTQLNYLQSSGSQYIAIPYFPVNSTYYYKIVAEMLGSSVENGSFTRGTTYFGYQGTASKIEIFWNTAKNSVNASGKLTLEWKTDGKFVNGTYVGGIASLNRTEVLVLFANWTVGGSSSISGGNSKIYSIEVKDDNNNYLFNLTPCLDKNNRPCFYDLANENTYYNLGTSEFLYG